jgi:hypothetical protein
MARLDFSRDQAVVDNLEVVTFTSVRTAGNSSSVVADAGVYKDGNAEARPSHGVYTKVRQRFTIRYDALRGVGGAKPRDTVTFAGDTYTVLEAALGEITNFWQLRCVRLVLAADLDQSGTLTRYTAAVDAAYRQTNAATTTVGTVNCRLQPEGGAAGDVFDRRTIPKRYTAYLASALAAQAKDVFTVDGQGYTVLEVRDLERLDELPSLVLEEVT